MTLPTGMADEQNVLLLFDNDVRSYTNCGCDQARIVRDAGKPNKTCVRSAGTVPNPALATSIQLEKQINTE